MTPLYKKARLYVLNYNCAKFEVSMYNSVRKVLDKFADKQEKRKRERTKERQKEKVQKLHLINII